MNEQLNELAIQAGIEFTYDPTETPMRAFAECWADELEKFAVLVVRECAKASYKYAADSKNYAYYDDVGWDCLPSDMKSHIEQHFGVEE